MMQLIFFNRSRGNTSCCKYSHVLLQTLEKIIIAQSTIQIFAKLFTADCFHVTQDYMGTTTNRLNRLNHPYLIFAFQIDENFSLPYFPFFNNRRPQPYLSRTLFYHFLHYKTPAVPYFSILNTLKSQWYIFLVFEQYKTSAVLQPYLILAFSTI